MSRDNRFRLQDILDAIDRIGSYVEGMTYADFLADRKTQDAVTRNIEIIGEAARSLTAQFKQEHPSVPWEETIAMRNVVVHQYFGVLPDVIWDVIENELPPLRSQIAEL